MSMSSDWREAAPGVSGGGEWRCERGDAMCIASAARRCREALDRANLGVCGDRSAC